jgi:tetratricopeptide (TPR) repeat protein
MMATKKKVSRKRLLKEPDEFLSLSARLFQFVVEHKYQVLAALGGVILIVLGLSGWRYYSHQRDSESLAAFQKLWDRYESLRNANDSDPQRAYQNVRDDFEQLIADYGERPGGRFARVIFADICYDGGEVEKAIAHYNEALQDFPPSFYRDQILSGLGYAHEAKGEYAKAVAFFEEIAKGSNQALKAESLFNLGRLYAKLGEEKMSHRAFQKIVENAPQSLYAELAAERTAITVPAAPDPLSKAD